MFDDGRVLRHRHHIVNIADNMDERNLGFGKGFETNS
jgi:hypothetical protein